eukprot:203794-Pleurochrysis_carterae.AAC.1
MQTRRCGRPSSRVPSSAMSTPCPTPSTGSSEAPTSSVVGRPRHHCWKAECVEVKRGLRAELAA